MYRCTIYSIDLGRRRDCSAPGHAVSLPSFFSLDSRINRRDRNGCDACRLLSREWGGRKVEKGREDLLILWSPHGGRGEIEQGNFSSSSNTHTVAQHKRNVPKCSFGMPVCREEFKRYQKKDGFDFWSGRFYEMEINKGNQNELLAFQSLWGWKKSACVCVISARSRDRSAAFAATQQNPPFHLTL